MNAVAAGIMQTLPVEVLGVIAGKSPAAYRAMLAVPQFARSLNPGTIVDYKIRFGHNIRITKDVIVWYYRGWPHRLDGPAAIYTDGTRRWRRHGLLHRADGPAVEHPDGSYEWLLDNCYHREGGPAILHSSGTKKWYRHGLLHREDGPAVEYADGDRHRRDGPAVECADGASEWWDRGRKCDPRW